MTAQRFAILNEYMESCMRDSAHDKGHIRRVLDAALLLARKEKQADLDVLMTAALLHDIGREEQFRMRLLPGMYPIASARTASAKTTRLPPSRLN